MTAKEINPIRTLCFTQQVTLTGLQQFVGVKAQELCREAVQHNLEIMGPVYWVYDGMDGKPETVFTLDICIPVAGGRNYNGQFTLKQLGAFKCLTDWHNGSWSAFPATYGRLFQEIGKRQYIPSGQCREIYLHVDFEHEENNVTEVQIGIQ
jgi:effector-binding domain-containing protein